MLTELTSQECYTIGILFYANILNYMDRYSVAGILENLQTEFDITDDYGGLLQTAYLVSYSIFAPLFGYLGDRYSRRIILIFSLFLWSGGTLIGSFATTYGWFFFTRTIVGAGESCFSAIAPTVIYDVTYREIRKNVLSLFYTAVPIGVACGIVISTLASHLFGHWSWGLRITPIFSVVGIILLYFIKDPIRGERELLETGKPSVVKKSNYGQDLLMLVGNRSYIFSTLGFTCVTFLIGALSWWGPKFFHFGFRLIPGKENVRLSQVTAAIAPAGIISGMIGVPLGALISSKISTRYPACDPIICAFALFLGDPLLVTGFLFADESISITYVTVSIGVTLMNTTWTLVADILLSCVVPECRSTAEAFQIVVSHSFGDAGSPYVVGVLSEYFKSTWIANGSTKQATKSQEFKAMQASLICIAFIQIIGGMLFLANAFYIEEDRATVLEAIASSAKTSRGET